MRIVVCLTLSRLSVGACKIRLKVQVDHAPQAPAHNFIASDGCRGSGDHPGLCQSSRLLDGFGSQVTFVMFNGWKKLCFFETIKKR